MRYIQMKRPKTIKIPEFLRKGQFLVAFYEWTLQKRDEDIFYISDKQFDEYYKRFIKELK